MWKMVRIFCKIFGHNIFIKEEGEVEIKDRKIPFCRFFCQRCKWIEERKRFIFSDVAMTLLIGQIERREEINLDFWWGN